MSIKSFHLVKGSSWSLMNECHLNTLAVCSLLPCAELCHPGQPLEHAVHCRQLCLPPRATMVRMGLGAPWLLHGPSAEARACPGYPCCCWCIPGAARCSPGSAMPRTKVQRWIFGKYNLGKDPFSAVPLRSVTHWPSLSYNSVFTNEMESTGSIYWLLNRWSDGRELSHCVLTEPPLLPWAMHWGQLSKSWYLSSCVWKCLIDLEAQNFNTVLFCIDRGIWSHLNALLSIHTRI